MQPPLVGKKGKNGRYSHDPCPRNARGPGRSIHRLNRNEGGGNHCIVSVLRSKDSPLPTLPSRQRLRANGIPTTRQVNAGATFFGGRKVRGSFNNSLLQTQFLFDQPAGTGGGENGAQ